MMRTVITIFLAMIQIAVAEGVTGACAHAQGERQKLALKNGESVELGPLYWVVNCRSTMIGLPEIEILEGPPEVTLSVKEAQVLPRRQGCAAKVPGGTLMLSAKGITEEVETKLTYRVKYKTKDGNRQTSNGYIVSLFP
jgi:hypothetical protein